MNPLSGAAELTMERAREGRHGPLTVELTHTLDIGRQDAASLQGLIESRPHVGVFLSTAWLSGFFVEPPAGVEPTLALVREGAALRAVAPLGLCRHRRMLHVSLLGGGLGSDRTDLVAARGYEAACADTLLAWLGQAFGPRAFVLELRDVPADSPLWGAVQRAGAEGTLALALQPREVHTLPYLDLAEPWPSAVTDRTSASLDKHRRWLERRGHLRIDILEDAAEVGEAFGILVRFLNRRWRETPGGSALDEARRVRFHEHVLPRLLAEDRLRMIRLSSDGRPVAVFYGLAGGGWWGYYLAGYDREWAGRIHLGHLTLAAAIELAAKEGALEFDFLKGADRVKYRWPVRERASLDADLFSSGAGAQLVRAARAAREAMVACAKSARDVFSTHIRSSKLLGSASVPE